MMFRCESPESKTIRNLSLSSCRESIFGARNPRASAAITVEEGESMGDTWRARTTGRTLVSFARGTWGQHQAAVDDQFEATFNPIGAVALSLREPPNAKRASACDDLGVAVIDVPPDQCRATNLGTREGLRVRPEFLVARPSTRVDSRKDNGVFVDDGARSWMLQALAVGSDDREGEGITVGVIDSGVDASHPALSSCLVRTSPIEPDLTGHGTHCAGIIAGQQFDRSMPRFGIAPRARVRSYRVFNAQGEAPEMTVRQAVHRAVLDGCKVISLAAGFPSRVPLDEDVELASFLRERGCLMFAAAGNESDRLARHIEDTLAPANAPYIMAIGAITPGRVLWNASNGKGNDPANWVDAVAPGISVLSCWPGRRTLHMSGTSVATAVAAGVAAAIWSRDTSASAVKVVARMRQAAGRDVRGDRDGLGDGALRVRSETPPTANAREERSPKAASSRAPTTLTSRDLRREHSMDEEHQGNGTIADFFSGIAALLRENPGLRGRFVCAEIDGAGKVSTKTIDATGNTARLTFNLQGHAVIAYIAEQYLEQNNPDTFRRLQGVKGADPIGRGDIASFAMWPDRLKHPPPGEEDAYKAQKDRLGSDRALWHYVNIVYDPATRDAKPDPGNAHGDLLKELPGQLQQLSNTDPLIAADALAFVLHLVGDLHQPLHCAALNDGTYFSTPPEYDRGGNLIRWGKDTTRFASSLHGLWDDFIAMKNDEVERRVSELMQQVPKESFDAGLFQMSLNDIAVESFELAKTAYDDFLAKSTYVGPSVAAKGGQQFTPPPDEYRANGRKLIRERAALAGYRLAALLATSLSGT
jgi:subtilisin family serine protease